MIHFCFLDPDESTFSSDGHYRRLWRIEIGTRWFHLGIALHPDDRYVGNADIDPDGVYWFRWIRK